MGTIDLVARLRAGAGRGRPGRPLRRLPGIRGEYEAGATIVELCGRHAVTYPTLRRELLAQGTRMRPRGTRRGTVLPGHPGRKIAVEDAAVIVAELRRGMKQAELAARFGITRQRVGQIGWEAASAGAVQYPGRAS